MNRREQVFERLIDILAGTCNTPTDRDYSYALGDYFGALYDDATGSGFHEKIRGIWERQEDAFYAFVHQQGQYFKCASCSWWYEVHEATEDPDILEEVCQGCHPYEEDW